MNQEIQTEQILGALGQLQRQEPGEAVWQQISNRIQVLEKKITGPRLWLAAAALAGLLVVNVLAWQRSGNQNQESGMKQLVQEYQLDPAAENTLRF